MCLHSGSGKGVPQGLAWTVPRHPQDFCHCACPGTAKTGKAHDSPLLGPEQCLLNQEAVAKISCSARCSLRGEHFTDEEAETQGSIKDSRRAELFVRGGVRV